MNDYKYALLYDLDYQTSKKGFVPSDAIKSSEGLCDAMMFVSIIKPEDGSYSQLVTGYDGKTDSELTQKDIFKVWLTMGLMLSDNNGLEGWQKKIVDVTTDLVREIFKI